MRFIKLLYTLWNNMNYLEWLGNEHPELWFCCELEGTRGVWPIPILLESIFLFWVRDFVDKFFSRNQGIASWDVQTSQGFLFFHNPQGLLLSRCGWAPGCSSANMAMIRMYSTTCQEGWPIPSIFSRNADSLLLIRKILSCHQDPSRSSQYCHRKDFFRDAPVMHWCLWGQVLLAAALTLENRWWCDGDLTCSLTFLTWESTRLGIAGYPNQCQP